MSPLSVRPLIVTPGDPDGIGPEIVWNSVRSRQSWDPSSTRPLVCVGPLAPYKKMRAKVRLISPDDLAVPEKVREMATQKNLLWLIAAPVKAPPKSHRSLAGFQSGWSIEFATQLIQDGLAAGLVTGPIHKDRLRLGGFNYPGHTEFLAHLTHTPEVTMMLANPSLRVSLVTTHLALAQVSSNLTSTKITKTIQQTLEGLVRHFGIKKPRIAVAALNPHGGESGLFGKEEAQKIEPAIRRCQKLWGSRAEIVGPLPADTLFAQNVSAPKKLRWDAVICMYHDQGLIPIKLIDFPNTVNITLGLPMVRTSVDHGTAFDLVGTGRADPRSFQAAVLLATKMASAQDSVYSIPKKRKLS